VHKKSPKSKNDLGLYIDCVWCVIILLRLASTFSENNL